MSTKFSGSLDEFRLWNKKQTSESIYNNYISGINGGANTDDYRTELSVYYKFNEGKTTDTDTDRIVLDYSGRLANGYWQDYVADSRQSGSYTSSEVADPIVRSNHPEVQALLSEMETSGSQYDANSKMSLYGLVPDWMKDEDEENGEELKHIVQIIASYFDKLYAQIEFLTDLKTKKYYQDDEKPLPFARRLLEEKGLVVPDILVNRSIIEYFGKKDLNGIQYEKDIEILKNRIYHNIYNNLEYIYKSKGTEKAYRNMLRCFGIDDEIVKLNLYTDNGKQYLTDKTKHTSQKTKHVDFDEADNFSATVYQENFISGSGTQKLEKNNAITVEAEVLVPKKPDERDSFYYSTPFQSSSVYGLDAYQGTPSSYKTSSIEDNFQLYLVKDTVGSDRAKWVLNQLNHTSTTVQSSSALVIPSGSVFTSSASIDITGTDGFSFAFWFKPSIQETDNEQEFLKLTFSDNNELKFEIFYAAEKVKFLTGGSNNRLWVSTADPYDLWNFIVVTTDANGSNLSASNDWTMYHYRDNSQMTTNNKLKGPYTTHPDISTITNITIGTSDLNEDHFSGSFDEITIWNKELSSQDVQNLHDLQGGYDSSKTILTDSASNLVRHWRFAGNLNENNSGEPFSLDTLGAGTHYFERHDSFPYEYDVTTETTTKTEVLSSSFYEEMYNNQRWNIATRVYPEAYPFAGSYASSSNPNYIIELYGVTHNFDEVLHEFKVTASLPYETGSALLSTHKKLYVGARRTNWSGSVEAQSDVKIAAASVYYDKLDDQSIKQHNLDPSNYGHNRVFSNPTPFLNTAENTHLPAQHTLALHWDFQTVTASDSSGEFVVEDFSSASVNGRYGWLGNVVTQEHKGIGFGFPASNTGVVKNEFVFASKKELPEISFTSDSVTIVDQDNEYLYEDEDISDNVFAFEKSMYQVVSEEMLNMFSTIVEYSNLFAKPVDRYRFNYKRLAHAKKLFFEKTSQDLDLDRFTNYYKWIDASISHFLQQLHPASAKFNKGIVETVESHILERPKYQHLLPNIEEQKTIKEQPARGIGELTYDWKHGHAPNYTLEDYNAKAIQIGANSYLQHSNAANLTGSNGSSVSLWYQPVSVSGIKKIIQFGPNIWIRRNGSSMEVTTNAGSSYETFSSYFSSGQTVHIAWAIQKAGGSYVYKNSTSVGAIGTPSATFTGNLQIGFESENDKFDEISIWNKVLTNPDVASIYNSNVASNLLNHTSASNLVSYYRLGDHPNDNPDRPFKGYQIYDSTGNYDLDIKGASDSEWVDALAGTTKAITDEVNINCLWRKEREERSGTNSTQREQLRVVISSETYVEETPSFGDNSGGTYVGSTYALRKFSKPYKLNIGEQRAIHGGINYSTPKDRDLAKAVMTVHGKKSSIGAPVEALVIGVGEGQGLVDPDPCLDVLQSPTAKTKYNTTVIVGKFSNLDGSSNITGSNLQEVTTAEYIYNIKGERILPFNLVSGSESTGYNNTVDQNYKKNAILTNLHSDTTDRTNEIPIQGPFTNTWVGGRQSRHIGLNRGTDTYTSRPEEFRLLFGEHPDEAVVDGALGIVGPDYGGPYPDAERPWAIHYRDGRVKRPINVQNHQTTDEVQGNYSKNYEVVQTTGRLENNKAIKDLSDTGSFIAKDIGLPATTHETSLIGVVPGDFGNIVEEYSNRLTSEIKTFPTNSTGISSTDTVIATRFSAPGGFEVGSEAFLDAHAKEYSVYNSLNFRNLSVLNNSGDTSIGVYGSSKALKAPEDLTQEIKFYNNSVSGYPTFGGFAFSFWANFESLDNQFKGIFHGIDSTTDSGITFGFGQGELRLFIGSGSAINSSDFRRYDWDPSTIGLTTNTWTHFIINWTGDFSNDPDLYINNSLVSIDSYFGSKTSGTGYDQIVQIEMLESSTELDASIQEFVFYSNELDSMERDLVYNGGEYVDLTTANGAPSFYDYWRFGEESNLSSFSIGDTLPTGTVIESLGTLGNNLTSSGDVVISEGFYNTIIRYTRPLLSVNSHASRREGLNTLHQRHCGRYGLDSTHGSVSSSDYNAEASFHKIHRNTLTTTTIDKALRMPEATDSVTGLITGDVQSVYPSSGYLSVSFWAKLDKNYSDSDYKFVVEADDNSNQNILIVNFLNGKLWYRVFQGAGGGSTTTEYSIPVSNPTSWNHYVIVANIDQAQTAPTMYINSNSISVTTEGGNYTGNIGQIAGRLSLMGNDIPTNGSVIQGSLQHFAFYNKALSQDEISEIYSSKNLTNTTLKSNIIDYWLLGNEPEFDDFNEGQAVTDGLSFNATIGSTSLTIDQDTFISKGKYFTKDKNNNFYVQTNLPQSDYNYSWVDSSLGDNYNVRSGTQKVFGYWPKNGMLSSSSGFDSAITFPTASTIQGS